MKSDARPAARALMALELIQNRPGVTAEQLGDRLGVTDRAARRYVGMLREAGVPVESARGPYGGYRVGRGVRLPPVMFSAAEALSLVMAVLDGHHDATDPTDPVGSAVGKLLRALPPAAATQAEALRRTTAPAPDRAAARPDPQITTTLVQACSDHRRVRLDYRTEAGSEWLLEADPWAVVVRHGRWYVLCWSHSANAQRAYRVDRTRAVDVLEQTFAPPVDLDPVAALEDHLAVGWEFAVDVVVDAPAGTVARWLPRALGRLEPVDDDTCRLVATTSNPAWYAEQLAMLPVPYRIAAGPQLREAAQRAGERLLAAAAPVDG